MTKKQFAERMAERMGGRCSRQAVKWVDAFIATLKESLAEGERLQLRGFGEISAAMTPARSGRDIKTGERITIAPRVKLRVKEYDGLREALNKGRQ